MRPDDLCWLSATALAAAVRTVEVSGRQIVGRRFAEATVLRAAAAFEAARPWSARRPEL